MHVFTSITSNYIPKASVLAASVKRHHPEATFHVVLSDEPPGSDGWRSAFDSVIAVEDLAIDGLRSWIFKHSVVELCTAVKGPAFRWIADKFGADRIYYFDPDIAVLSSLETLEEELGRYSVLLTPHLCAPERDKEGIADNEICALRHGVYNLGFLAVRMSGRQGRAFVDWWADRLLGFCYDDIPLGLFTDQRWVDLAPAFFDDLGILRGPQYNVATWNLSNRTATGTAPDDVLVNGVPLCFFHFSGMDSGAQEAMLGKYGRSSPVLADLRRWYLDRCAASGQGELGRTPCVYSRFDNGEPISREQRLLYRDRGDLIAAFPDPFATSDPNQSYYHWYLANGPGSEARAGATAQGPAGPRARASRVLAPWRRFRKGA